LTPKVLWSGPATDWRYRVALLLVALPLWQVRTQQTQGL